MTRVRADLVPPRADGGEIGVWRSAGGSRRMAAAPHSAEVQAPTSHRCAWLRGRRSRIGVDWLPVNVKPTGQAGRAQPSVEWTDERELIDYRRSPSWAMIAR